MQKTKNRIYLLIILVLVIALVVGGYIFFAKARAAKAAAEYASGKRTESTVESTADAQKS